jgi:hypothetical protein
MTGAQVRPTIDAPSSAHPLNIKVTLPPTGSERMSLILFYIAFMFGGALAAYFLGLLVEYEWGPHVSLIVFLAVYFCALWVSWVLAVWVTKPRHFAQSASQR